MKDVIGQMYNQEISCFYALMRHSWALLDGVS